MIYNKARQPGRTSCASASRRNIYYKEKQKYEIQADYVLVSIIKFDCHC